MSNYTITATLNYSRQPPDLRRLLLTVIADAIGQHTDIARVDTQKLMHLCNTQSVRPIQKTILRLIQSGELIGIMNPRLGGGGWYEFVIPIYPGEEGYNPQPCDAEDHFCNGRHTPLTILRESLYMDRAKAARAPAKQVSGKRRRPVVHKEDNSATYPQGASPETQAPASPETQGASPETQGASPETQGASPETRTYRNTHIYPDVSQMDPGAISPQKRASLAELRAWSATPEGSAAITRRGHHPPTIDAVTLRSIYEHTQRRAAKGAAQ